MYGGRRTYSQFRASSSLRRPPSDCASCVRYGPSCFVHGRRSRALRLGRGTGFISARQHLLRSRPRFNFARATAYRPRG
jgi:hypothetical protein